jgi:hypothetical protein
MYILGVWREEHEMRTEPTDVSGNTVLVNEVTQPTGASSAVFIDESVRDENSGSTTDEGTDSSLAGDNFDSNDDAKVAPVSDAVFTGAIDTPDYADEEE